MNGSCCALPERHQQQATAAAATSMTKLPTPMGVNKKPPSSPATLSLRWPARQDSHASGDISQSDCASKSAGHGQHASAPLISFIVPASHATHGPPSDPVYPASHSQSVSWSLPELELECDGHAAQLPHPAVAWEYVSAEHALHKAHEVQLAVKPQLVPTLRDENCTIRCRPVVSYVASAGEPLSVASRTLPSTPHDASLHATTYTLSLRRVEKDVNDTVGLSPVIIHQQYPSLE